MVRRRAIRRSFMKTILLVEDDPLIIQVYRGPLENRGFEVYVAPDGLEAMKVLLPLRPDMVVLDVMMPKLDGNDVLKFIRTTPELAATKVIILSSASYSDVASVAMAHNPSAVFLKSYCTPSLLAERISAELGTAEPGEPLPPA
jgi:CheY-like chemotaxis protein